MTERNALGIGRFKLYVVKSFAQYAFYFASNPLEVSVMHREKFGERTGAITEAHRLLIKVMYFADLGIHIPLIDHRKTIVQFPAYLGPCSCRTIYFASSRSAQRGERYCLSKNVRRSLQLSCSVKIMRRKCYVICQTSSY